ncbi:MAG: ABC transporter permease [Planctomycetaceae bacterium]
MRSGFIGAMLVLFYSIRQATIGFQDVQFAGDVASFSNLVFQLFAVLQLTLGMFFATLFTASNIAQEKDRQTLILLLMTDMRNHELALGKLMSSLLVVVVLVGASLPVFASLRLLGGITWSQIIWVEAIIATASLAAGTWGGMVAFWREKTFQTLAISVLGVVIFLSVVEGLASGIGGPTGAQIGQLSPYRSMMAVLNPMTTVQSGVAEVSALSTVAILLGLSAGLSVYTILRLRTWNPSQQLRQSALQSVETSESSEETVGQEPVPASPRHHRTVWNNPVIWREMRTRAYGRKVGWIKLVYALLVVMLAWSTLSVTSLSDQQELVLGMVGPAAFSFIGVGIISLLLMNAQAVTSITNERDGRTLEPLLITDLSAKEFMLAKIGGAMWNAREMIILPLIFLVTMATMQSVTTLSVENLVYVIAAYLVLSLFAVSLGLHAGLTYDNSRSAIGNSLGTMFFLFIGIFIFMLLLVEARSSFFIQIQSFIVFIGFGSLGLYSSLTHKNPSNALTLASMVLPFLTFYGITDFLLGGSLGVCFWICVAYGFASIAMLVPAMTDFDVALGRNTQDVG